MKLKNRNVDEYGRVSFDENGLVELIKTGRDISGASINMDSWYKTYLDSCDRKDQVPTNFSILEDLKETVEEFDQRNQNSWKMPDKYRNLDIEVYLVNLCSTEEQYERLGQELDLYEERGLFDLLRCLVYMIDCFRENGIVWGVGRGSSVSSYVLFLIGVHKIDSLKYGLDIHEFLR